MPIFLQFMLHCRSGTMAHWTIKCSHDIHGCDVLWCGDDGRCGPQSINHNANPWAMLKHTIHAWDSHLRYGASQCRAQSNTFNLILRSCCHTFFIFYMQRPWLTSHKLWDCIKSSNDFPNTITMVAEPLAPPAASIQQIHAAWGVGGLVHAFSKATVEGFCKNQ